MSGKRRDYEKDCEMVNCKVSAGVSLGEEPTEGQKEAAGLVSGSRGVREILSKFKKGGGDEIQRSD